MIKELRRSIEKQPVGWLAAGVGVIAVAVVTRKLLQTPTLREQLVDDLQSGIGRVRKTGTDIWHDGMDTAHTLQNNAHALKASVAPTLDQRENSGLLSRMNNHESAIAAFMATLVAKGVSSYFQWHSMEQARARSDGDTSAEKGNSEEALDKMTVVELRKEAAEQEIEGRSSMNKDDLVEALKE